MEHQPNQAVSHLLTLGGDERIVPAHADGTNKYHSSPFPRQTVTFASSTANDISVAAFDHLTSFVAQNAISPDMGGADYARHLDAVRERLGKAYSLPSGTDIAFSASGTDLEYIALQAFSGRAPAGIHNVLLGADEVGSGCILSAHGQYFAAQTALGTPTVKGTPVPGLAPVSLTEISVRNGFGDAFDSGVIVAGMRSEIERAIAAQQFPLLHVVHGSKTGLILPHLDDIDALIARYGDGIGFVVDACQARITSAAIAAYLTRGAVVLLTGSKFMGGAPFSGFALVPQAIGTRIAPLGEGMATIFRRAELPAGWAGADRLPDGGNAGLTVRLEAALFELERFQALAFSDIARIIELFRAASLELIERIGGARVLPYPVADRAQAGSHPIEMRTLTTIDLSGESGAIDFDRATAIQMAMMHDSVRLGQPVKCARFQGPDMAGKVRGTLRVGISMPQIVTLAGLPADDAERSLAQDMNAVARSFARAQAATA
jgi:selenocysteine lyase/cysteine desulfurase